MNNPIDYAIGKVCRQIPHAILSKAFTEKDIFNPNQTVSPEFIIRTNVIEQVVIPDLQVMGGTHVSIPIWDLPHQYSHSGYLIDVPLERTQGLPLTSVQLVGNGNNTASTGGNDIAGMAQAIMNSNEGYVSGYSARAKIVAPNVVLVPTDYNNRFLEGTVGYDNRLSTIDKFYWNDISKLILLATKSIIYANYTLALGEMTQGGSTPNDRLVAIIESYESAQEEYDEFLEETMSTILILADPKARNEHLDIAFGRF